MDASAVVTWSRRFFNAARTQVLTVPSGWPMRSAISVCDKTFEVSQLDHLPLAGGKLFDRGLHAPRAVGRQDSLLHVDKEGRMIGLFEFHAVAFAAAGGTQIIDGAIARNGQQPWADGAFPGIESLCASSTRAEKFPAPGLRRRRTSRTTRRISA